jgi:hypothetical protein
MSHGGQIFKQGPGPFGPFGGPKNMPEVKLPEKVEAAPKEAAPKEAAPKEAAAPAKATGLKVTKATGGRRKRAVTRVNANNSLLGD